MTDDCICNDVDGVDSEDYV